MERDDDIEKISKELEDILKMTSDEKKDRIKEVGHDQNPGNQLTEVVKDYGEVDTDYEAMPVIRLDVPVEGMEELYEYDEPEEESDFYSDDELIITEEEEENTDQQLDYKEVTPSYRKKAHKNASLVKKTDGLMAAFLVPLVIMIIIFAQRGIFPFGEESFLRTDMYHQYAPFFSEFQYKLKHGGSLLYSWDIGMGVNFAALYSYYLASPLNWLIVLCPKKYIIEFMTYMIVLKVGLSGLTFSWYLRRHFKTADFGIAFFGIFYALSGYMAAYSWNIMWLDCILLFPLIMLGVEKLVQEKKCILYCITLGLSLIHI